MKEFLYINIFFFSLLISVQENKHLLINKTFKAKVGTVFMETPDNNPCTGEQIYLILEFEKEEVLVLENYISTCGKESKNIIGKFKWELIENTKLKIDVTTEKIKDTSLDNLELEIKNNLLIGKKSENKNLRDYNFKSI